MSRKRSKATVPEKAAVDATGEAVSAPPAGGGGTTSPGPASGSALNGPFKRAQLLQPPVPEIATDPYGFTYMNLRSRSQLADSVQMRVLQWGFSLQGFYENGATSPQRPGLEDSADLLTRAYGYLRQMGSVTVKYKHTPEALIDVTNFQNFWNLSYYVIAQLHAYLNAMRLYQFNLAGLSFATYTLLPAFEDRIIRLWRRASALRMPGSLRARALRDSLPVYDPIRRVVHVNLFSPFTTPDCTTVYGVADYTDHTGEYPHILLTDATHIGESLTNVESALVALEAYVSSNADDATDFRAIRDLVAMLSYVDAFKEYFPQGLPPEDAVPGLVADASLVNGWYCRMFSMYDTKGLGGDEKSAFPVCGMTGNGFDGKIPIFGMGTPTIDDFNLFGAPKFAILDSAENDLAVAVASEHEVMGTLYPVASLGGSARGLSGVESAYTREDGWISLTTAGTDFGDATAIKDFLQANNHLVRHNWNRAMFEAQGGADYRWVEDAPTSYQMWIPEANFYNNHVVELSRMFGIPYIK